MAEPVFHPEGTAVEGGAQGQILSLVDWSTQRTVHRLAVSPAEWSALEGAGVDCLFSGQVHEVTRSDADRQVRDVIGRGFDL